MARKGFLLIKPASTPLLENAVDSLRHGIAHYLTRDESPTAIKHAILNIYHSIELFMKERLARVHPVLIYRNIDKRITDDSQTVGLVEIAGRMENLGFPLSPSHFSALTELQKRRNRIEHHRFDPTDDHVLSVGQGLKFLLEFLPEHLEIELEILVEEKQYFQVLDAILSYKERVARAQQDAEASGHAIRCPDCGEKTVSVSLGEDPFCFLCQEVPDIEKCERCDEYVPSSEIEFDMCGECFDTFMEKW